MEMKICTGIELPDGIMDVKFKFEKKNLRLWCHCGSKFALSNRLCTKALPLPQCNTACDLDTKVSPLTRAIVVSAPSIFSLKIQAYGITDDLNWIKHFLRDRYQCRQIGQHCSVFTKIVSGVVQGCGIGHCPLHPLPFSFLENISPSAHGFSLGAPRQ